jgi:hypothetical protein
MTSVVLDIVVPLQRRDPYLEIVRHYLILSAAARRGLASQVRNHGFQVQHRVHS